MKSNYEHTRLQDGDGCARARLVIVVSNIVSSVYCATLLDANEIIARETCDALVTELAQNAS